VRKRESFGWIPRFAAALCCPMSRCHSSRVKCGAVPGKVMSANLLVAVIGADGFVGGQLAEALQAERIVYGPARTSQEININEAEELVRRADVIINAGGFRVRPGLSYPDYQRSHEAATSALVPWVRKRALFVHLSSAAVLGKSKDQKLGNRTPPNPRSFPSPAYALAKLEADQFLQRAAADRGFRLVILRPAVLYSRQGDSMLDTLVRLAKRGLLLDPYPRMSRHHLCSIDLFVEVVRRVVRKGDLPQASILVIADPFTITNRDLETMIRKHLRQRVVALPLALPLMSAVLRHSFHSGNPRLDLVTWGEILGVLSLDTVYDPHETFSLLGVEPTRYSLEASLEPIIREALQQ